MIIQVSLIANSVEQQKTNAQLSSMNKEPIKICEHIHKITQKTPGMAINLKKNENIRLHTEHGTFMLGSSFTSTPIDL